LLYESSSRMRALPQRSTLFPYTTLFRSVSINASSEPDDGGDGHNQYHDAEQQFDLAGSLMHGTERHDERCERRNVARDDDEHIFACPDVEDCDIETDQ